MAENPGIARRTLGAVWRLAWRLVLLFVGVTLGLVVALRWLDPPTSAFMMGERLGGRPVQQEWEPYERIAPAMKLAVIASEDQRFPDHHGFDFKEINNAVETYQRGGGLRGASTISQQTAKNLFLWPGRNFVRKGVEAWFTLLMETLWPKQRILEIYLNVAEFGPGVYGVGAASKRYFGKDPSALSRAEAALLAAVLPNPREYRVMAPGEHVRKRQRWILRQMDQLGEAYLRRLK